MPGKPTRGAGLPAPPEPWSSFLGALDDLLNEAVELHCIGGFVITMHYGLSRGTSDIDILPTLAGHKLEELQRLAGQNSELHQRFKVYLEPVGIVTFPEEYASRLQEMWPNMDLHNLRLFAMEAHDLALTKLERNSDVDRQDVLGLAEADSLDPTTLRERYIKEFRPNLVSGVEKHDLTLPSLPFARDLLRTASRLARMRARPLGWSLALSRSRGARLLPGGRLRAPRTGA